MLNKVNNTIGLVNLRIQSEYRKIQTRNNYVFGHFSRSDFYENYKVLSLDCHYWRIKCHSLDRTLIIAILSMIKGVMGLFNKK